MENTFEVTSGKIIVTDPCYDRNIHESNWILNAKNGTWIGEVSGTEQIVRYSNSPTGHFDNWIVLGTNLSVDSGQTGVFDHDAYPQGDTGEYDDLTSFYGKACAMTLSDDSSGSVDNIGFVSGTTYGDGTFTFYGIKNADNEIVAVKTVYAEEKEDEEEDNWDEYEEYDEYEEEEEEEEGE